MSHIESDTVRPGRVRPPSASGPTLKQQAREAVMAAILDGRLRPGQKIRQKQMAEAAGLSVTPLREALNELNAEGLIDIDPRRGASVRVLDLQEYNELSGILRALLPLAARAMAENATPAELDAAEQLQAELEQTTDFDLYLKRNRTFHRFLAGCARAPHLSRILGQISDRLSDAVNISIRSLPNRIAQANEDHRRLLAALRNRDADLAAEISLAHNAPSQASFREFAKRR